MNCVEAIEGLQSEIKRREAEHAEKIQALNVALNELLKLNTVCLKCGGAKGGTYRIVAEAEPEWHDCRECNGTGKAKPYKQNGG